MGNSSGMKINLGPLQGGIRKLGTRLPLVVAGVVERRADIATGEMKNNATWTDRTGNARSGLRADTEHSVSQHVIHLMHSVSYGIWLEIRWGGKYAIIVPTIISQGKALMEDLNALMRRF